MRKHPVTECLERRLLMAVTPGPEFRVNTHTPDTQAFPATAMDADGDFVVTWQSRAQDDPPSVGDGVYAQRYDAAGVPQGGEFRVSTTVFSNQTKPQVAMSAAGDFVIAWESPDAGDSGIYARLFNAAGVAQGGEFRVNTFQTDFQTLPTVAMDADGDFVVAWQSQKQVAALSFNDVFAQRFDKSGATVGPEFRVNTVTESQQWYPTAAMDAAGDFVIAWESLQHDPDNSAGIYAQRYDAAGAARGGEFRVNSYTVSDQNLPSAAMDADGDFVVTWNGYELNGNYGIFARRFDATGAAGAEFKVSTTLAGFQRYTAVAMDADGDLVIAWQDEHSGPTPGFASVTARRFTSGGAAETGEFVVNTTEVGHHHYPAAAMDADGDFVVAWAGYGQDPGDNSNMSGVYARLYRAPAAPRVTKVFVRGTTWGPAFMNYLQAQGLGSSQFGFAIGGGAAQLANLPWTNMNQISITFDRDVDLVSPDLAVRGVSLANYIPAAFVYNATAHTGTWTLGQDLVNDKLMLDLDGDAGGVTGAGAGGQRLDGEWATGTDSYPSGDGAAGGDFRFRLNVLPGDVNRSGTVLADDFSEVKKKFFSSTAAVGAGAAAYGVLHDVNGSGSVLADDFSDVKRRFFNTLPVGSPALVATAAGSDPVSKGLFSSAPVLG